MQNDTLVRFLLELNKKQSDLFASSDLSLARRQYRAKHSTELVGLKCMDGRLNLSVMTQTPIGIIQPFRNLGGKFDLGWPYFGILMLEIVNYAIAHGHDVIVLVTYHFSKGDVQRGCAGFSHDREAAMAHARRLIDQFEQVFGRAHAVVYPIQVGIETDEDALLFHGRNGEILNVAEHDNTATDALETALQQLYPDMKEPMLRDLLPIVLGNQKHVREIREINRPLTEIVHTEQILGLGRGFDWLHLLNRALIVGPYSPDLAEPIATAGNILLSNLNGGRIPKDEGVVLFSAAVYRDETGPERLWAEQKARFLSNFGKEVLHKRVPELNGMVQLLTGTVNLNTRLFTPIN